MTLLRSHAFFCIWTLIWSNISTVENVPSQNSFWKILLAREILLLKIGVNAYLKTQWFVILIEYSISTTLQYLQNGKKRRVQSHWLEWFGSLLAKLRASFFPLFDKSRGVQNTTWSRKDRLWHPHQIFLGNLWRWFLSHFLPLDPRAAKISKVYRCWW